MIKPNYQKMMDKILDGLEKRPSLLLHACCAPCLSYVLEYLQDYFDITVYFYNPNIFPKSEYDKRIAAIEELLCKMGQDVKLMVGDYDYDAFRACAAGLENEPEGGARCEKCFYLRLSDTAKLAKKLNADYFCTTLTISPHKDAPLINSIGEELAKKEGVKFLPSDFKKKNGYLRSIELCREHDIYRQSYCGCGYALN